MKDLIDFYNRVISFAGLKTDDQGHVLSEDNDPIVVPGGQVLVLPTREQLANISTDKEVFHPLSEDTSAKITKALSTFLYRLNGHLNTTFAMVLLELKSIACSPARNKEMSVNPARLAYLRNIHGTFNEKTDGVKEEKFLKLIANRLQEDPSKAFFHIQPGRGGSYKGERMARTGYVSFEFYRVLKEDLELPRSKSAFQGFNKEELTLITQVYEAIFPGLDKSEAYNYGFSTGPYPFFTTVMETGYKIAEPLNAVIETFEGAFSEGTIDPISMSWRNTFENKELLSKLRYQVGHLNGNTPMETEKEGLVKVDKPSNLQTSTSVPKVAEEAKSKTGLSMDEWLQRKAVPSAMGAQANQMAVLNAHIEGYKVWYAQATAANAGIPPMNYPHPQQIAPGQMPPPYPGSPLNQPTMQTGWGQPPVVNAWGQPVQQVQQGWGQPVSNAWGQPVQGGWGQPVATNAWGQPVQQAQTAWGQPQVSNWGQQASYNSGSIIPGVR